MVQPSRPQGLSVESPAFLTTLSSNVETRSARHPPPPGDAQPVIYGQTAHATTKYHDMCVAAKLQTVVVELSSG
jgi:hypothetical protein